MFTFFHKRDTITLDCFTCDAAAYEMTPPVKASKTLPRWWKDLPSPGIGDAFSNPTENNNMRRCYGFVELFKTGLILENWGDIHINVAKTGYRYQAMGAQPGEHDSKQYAGAFTGYHHIKLVSPWAFREKTGTHFYYSAAEWFLEKYPFKILPGIIDHKINRVTNVNIMLPIREDPYDIYIPAGQPLVHIIPVTDKKLDIRVHLVDAAEMAKLTIKSVSFKGFRETLRLAKKNEARAGKCPFHQK
jgi:hypothetical protein